MVFRLFIALVVVILVFSACYYLWGWALMNLVPSEWGMPEYEDEMEFAGLVLSVIFAVVPTFISIKVCRLLYRRFPTSQRVPDLESH